MGWVGLGWIGSDRIRLGWIGWMYTIASRSKLERVVGDAAVEAMLLLLLLVRGDAVELVDK